MNQPTREEFEDLKEEVRKIREQQTEPIQITVERRYPDRELLQEFLQKQDEQFNYLKAEFGSLSKRQDQYDKGLLSHSRSIEMLQNEMKAARADILQIREAQADQRDQIKEIKDDILQIRESQADQRDQIKEIKDDILQIRESQADQRDQIKEIKDTMATKDDFSALKNDFSALKATQDARFERIETTQDKHELLLREILDRLPPKQ
jgi:chromosome segregation ATPase